jgi:hypothetical protein
MRRRNGKPPRSSCAKKLTDPLWQKRRLEVLPCDEWALKTPEVQENLLDGYFDHLQAHVRSRPGVGAPKSDGGRPHSRMLWDPGSGHRRANPGLQRNEGRLNGRLGPGGGKVRTAGPPPEKVVGSGHDGEIEEGSDVYGKDG